MGVYIGIEIVLCRAYHWPICDLLFDETFATH
jgi:hypothetical protein